MLKCARYRVQVWSWHTAGENSHKCEDEVYQVQSIGIKLTHGGRKRTQRWWWINCTRHSVPVLCWLTAGENSHKILLELYNTRHRKPVLYWHTAGENKNKIHDELYQAQSAGIVLTRGGRKLTTNRFLKRTRHGVQLVVLGWHGWRKKSQNSWWLVPGTEYRY